jgi:hypothetical protein
VLVAFRTDETRKKLLKQELLGSYAVLGEKHKTPNTTRGVILCSQLDGCNDWEIQAEIRIIMH